MADNEGRSGIGQAYHKRHGVWVDESIKVYVAGGSKTLIAFSSDVGIEPCAATLLDFIAASGYRIVACQVPIYSTVMGVATSIDIICTDVATSTEFYIFEVKSTAVVSKEAVERGDAAFEQLRGRLKSTTLRGMILSQYGASQVQAWTQMSIVKEITSMTPTGVSVLRVSPGIVREYPLNIYYKDRAEKLARAISIQTGQAKRNRKRARQADKALKLKKPKKV